MDRAIAILRSIRRFYPFLRRIFADGGNSDAWRAPASSRRTRSGMGSARVSPPDRVESIRRWWQGLGKARYPEARRLTVTADCGGSNGARLRLWKLELQRIADETGLAVTVAHLPPGTGKWNRIEHRLLACISQNRRGKPLVSHQVIVQSIAATTTANGFGVTCDIDRGRYPKGIKVSDAVFDAINIVRNAFHDDWNYTIYPRPKQPPYSGYFTSDSWPADSRVPAMSGELHASEQDRSHFFHRSFATSRRN